MIQPRPYCECDAFGSLAYVLPVSGNGAVHAHIPTVQYTIDTCKCVVCYGSEAYVVLYVIPILENRGRSSEGKKEYRVDVSLLCVCSVLSLFPDVCPA